MFRQALFVTFVLSVLAISELYRPPPVPEHKVAKDIPFGTKTALQRMIVIYARADLTREDCRALLSRYGRDLARHSQVIVEKLSLGGMMKPWCIDNHNGTGFEFHDHWFERAKAINQLPD